MEDIYSAPLETKVKELKKEGLSFRKIADTLNISLGKVQRTLTPKNDGVSIHQESVSKSVSDRIDTPKQSAVEQSESVADLKTKINTILKDIYNKIENIKVSQSNLTNSLEIDFNKRINNVISNSLNNQIEALREDLLKQLRGDKKQQESPWGLSVREIEAFVRWDGKYLSKWTQSIHTK